MNDGAQATLRPSPVVKCREITPALFDDTLHILTKAFPEHTRDYYVFVLRQLAEHDTPSGYPKFGYILQVNEVVVGVVLVIASAMTMAGEKRIRLNVSNWYVDPEYRGYAAMLTAPIRRFKEATYLNITPAPHTWTMLEALGYRRFANGELFAIAALSPRCFTARVRAVSSAVLPGSGLTPDEAELLWTHAGFGCISVVCEWKGQRHPFVFMRSSVKWKGMRVPTARLMYCRDFESFVRFAGPLGRFLLRHGLPVIHTDANGKVDGLVGRYVEWGPKFFRGPHQPQLGDLSYTEWVMFGEDAARRFTGSLPDAVAQSEPTEPEARSA